MTFADIVEEVRRLPMDAQLELSEVIAHEIVEKERSQIAANIKESRDAAANGNIHFTSNVDKLLSDLSAD